jgi:hypothetical protein
VYDHSSNRIHGFSKRTRLEGGRRVVGFKVNQSGSHAGGRGCRRVDKLNNAGLAMPLHESRKLPVDYVPVKIRGRFNRIYGRMMAGLTPAARAKYAKDFKMQALEQAWMEDLREKAAA